MNVHRHDGTSPIAPLPTKPYAEQAARWPASGRHILAQCGHDTVLVYQAYRPAIAKYAIEHGAFGGPDFSFSRMSWIKPNFLWMMYRSGWGSKEGQEFVLALRVRHAFFEHVLLQAVPSTHFPELHATRKEWEAALKSSEVRLQWDPDHDPYGNKLERRAIQVGLRGSVLREFATTELLEVIDMSAFVAQQREHVLQHRTAELSTPEEHVYSPENPEVSSRIALDAE